jgi:hypothetical protein
VPVGEPVNKQGKGEPKRMDSSEVIANIRDLIVHLHRGNGTQAESIVTNVAGHLKGIMLSGDDPAGFGMQRAQQTMFALDEVRLLLAQQDYSAAATAARDAAKEWKQQPVAVATAD